MRIIIFTEGGKKYGFGHLSRCLALAAELSRRRTKAAMVVCGDRSASDFCAKMRRSALFFDWTKEKKKRETLVREADCVIIDSYQAGIRVYRSVCRLLKQRADPGLPVYVDDCQRLDYPEGLIINPNIYGSSLVYDREKDLLLQGQKYIILRSSFCRVSDLRVRKKINKILINLGGTVGNDLIHKVIDALRNIDPKLNFHILASRFQSKPGLKARAYPVLSASAVKKLMLTCDLCVSGCGQSLAETARTGLPVIGICLADNQKENLAAYRKKGYLEYAGWYNDPELPDLLGKKFLRLISYGKRKKMSRKGRELVDGKGTQRIADKILKWIKK